MTRKILFTGLLLTIQWATMAQNEAKPTFASKLIHITEIGILQGRSEKVNNSLNGISRTDLTLIHFTGYKVGKSVAIGPFVGVDWYSAFQVMPVGIGIRGNFRGKKNVSPIFNLDTGYGGMWLNSTTNNQTNTGGLMINPMAGLNIGMGKETSLRISVGYKYQRIESYFDNGADTFTQYVNNYNRMAVRVGVEF